MTWPNELVSRGSDHHFAKYFRNGFFAYLRVASFDINDPVKENEAYYGKPSRAQRMNVLRGKLHVVTD